jgi:hypothetical protein
MLAALETFNRKIQQGFNLTTSAFSALHNDTDFAVG